MTLEATQYFYRGIGRVVLLIHCCFFFSVRRTAWIKTLKLKVFTFAMNLQIHFQQHMLAIH